MAGTSLTNGGTTSSGANVIADTALIFHGHAEMVRFADYSPDGSMVVTGDIHHTIVWDPSTGIEIGRCIDGHELTNVAFRPESRSIIATGHRISIFVSDHSISTIKPIALPASGAYLDAQYIRRLIP